LHVGDWLGRRPRQLSGGERQRASIARALLSDPTVLLLDEPLAHLDPSLKRSVRDEILGVHERFAGPVLYVTHDHVDAMSVGDRLAVLIDGRLEDVGEPQRVYDAPGSVAVARFLGERPMNLFQDGERLAGIRPERVRLAPDGALDGRVVRRESTGADSYLEIETERGPIVARVPAEDRRQAGDRVTLDLPAAWIRHFDANGAARR
jgi:ABC-type sugar transport system ATPase subunit